MTAFGRKNGPGGMNPGGRPSFGVARPMKGGSPAPTAPRMPQGGEQFPPLPEHATAVPSEAPATPSAGGGKNQDDAMARLSERMNATHENTEVGGFEASVHKIKE